MKKMYKQKGTIFISLKIKYFIFSLSRSLALALALSRSLSRSLSLTHHLIELTTKATPSPCCCWCGLVCSFLRATVPRDASQHHAHLHLQRQRRTQTHSLMVNLKWKGPSSRLPPTPCPIFLPIHEGLSVGKWWWCHSWPGIVLPALGPDGLGPPTPGASTAPGCDVMPRRARGNLWGASTPPPPHPGKGDFQQEQEIDFHMYRKSN